MKPTILFLFNSSDYAVRPWIDDGRFNVVSVDYDNTDHSGAHREPVKGHNRLSIDLSGPHAREAVEWALEARGMARPSLVVSFAPCTDLSVAGARHFASKLARDPDCQNRAVRMAQLAATFGCPYAVENPVSRLATLWRKPDMTFHPWEFAGYVDPPEHPEFPGLIPDSDRYNKKTCLWTGNGFRLPEKSPLAPLEGDNPGWAKLGGKSARTKYIRSLTPRGLSSAIYESNAHLLLQKLVDKAYLQAILATKSERETA